MALTLCALNTFEEPSLDVRPTPWRNLAENPQTLVFAVCLVVLGALIGTEIWASVRAFLYHPASTAQRSAVEPSQSFAAQIAGAELFGRAAADNLPETSLQLTLRAVFTASDSRNATAVVETPDGKTQIIRVGASVGGDATLQEVHPNRIVLARNGALETLMFPAPQDSSELSIAQNSSMQNGTPPAAGADAGPGGNVPPGASPDEIKRAAILQRLEELRARSSR